MRWILLVLVLALPSPGSAQSLMELLERGPVVSVREKDGRFESVLAVNHVRAPVETVWAVATDFEHYPSIMPKLVRTKVKQVKPSVIDVTFEVEVPGMNPVYTYRYTLSPDHRKMTAVWHAGNLKGSYTRWILVPYKKNETLIYYTSSSKNFNRMAQALEDKQQTLTVGVNVSSALAVVKGAQRAAEARWGRAKAAAAKLMEEKKKAAALKAENTPE